MSKSAAHASDRDDASLVVWHSPLRRTAPDAGVNRTVPRLGQALARHGVTVVVLRPSEGPRLRMVADPHLPNWVEAHVPMRGPWFSRAALGHLARDLPADLIHLHAAFIPHSTQLGIWARSRNIPYVVHHRGALAAPLLRRRSWRKAAYLWLMERKVFTHAALAIGNTHGDLRDLRLAIPDTQARLTVVPNPVVGDEDLEVLASLDPEVDARGPVSPFSLIYLGRWDVVHKGLDRLVSVMEASPNLRLDIYTALRFKKERSLARALYRRLPSNVSVKKPIYCEDKWRALTKADGYVQLARWESFGNSVAEALVAGTPTFLSAEMHIVADLASTDATITVDADHPNHVADRILEVLHDPIAVARLREAGRQYARDRYHEDRVANEMIEAYRSVLR